MDVKATSRSRNFGKTLEFFLDHIKGDIQGEDEGGCALQEKKSQAENTLLHLVTVLAGPDLVSWVKSFIDKTVLPESGDSHLYGPIRTVTNTIQTGTLDAKSKIHSKVTIMDHGSGQGLQA